MITKFTNLAAWREEVKKRNLRINFLRIGKATKYYASTRQYNLVGRLVLEPLNDPELMSCSYATSGFLAETEDEFYQYISD